MPGPFFLCVPRLALGFRGRLEAQLQVADPDGHVLRFGSDATDAPVGAWRDGQGRLWFPQSDGSWREEA